MANLRKIIQEISEVYGITYDKKRNIGCGNKQGFMILVHATQINNKPEINISFCASLANDPTKANLFEALADVVIPDKGRCVVQSNRIDIVLPVKGNVQANYERAVAALQTVMGKLREHEAVNCDSLGAIGETHVYLLKGAYTFMTDENQVNAQLSLNQETTQQNNIPENYLLGTIGALAGALVGVVAILIIARLNIIAYISGVVMAGAAVWAYKKLAGKFSLVGAIICSAICIAMTYLAFRIDMGYTIYDVYKSNYMSASFMECFANAKEICREAGILGDYTEYLVKMMMIGIIGSVATCFVIYSNAKSQFQMEKIG